MKKALEILRLKLDPDHKQFGKLLSIQSSLAGMILSATARVRASDLRDQDKDPIQDFLDDVRAQDGDDYAALFN